MSDAIIFYGLNKRVHRPFTFDMWGILFTIFSIIIMLFLHSDHFAGCPVESSFRFWSRLRSMFAVGSIPEVEDNLSRSIPLIILRSIIRLNSEFNNLGNFPEYRMAHYIIS